MSELHVIPQQRSLSDAAPDFWPWPERPELVDTIKSGRPLYTGKIVSKDEQLCRSVMIDLLTAELSDREIAARHNCGRETLKVIRSVMQERGELRPLEQTIRSGLSSCIVLMLARLHQALIEGEYSAAQIPISLCALIDKKGQLDAGIVPGTERTEAEAWESAVDAAARAFQKARALTAGQGSAPSENRSAAADGQVVDVQASAVPSSPPATGPATQSRPGEGSMEATEPSSGQAEVHPVQTSGAGEPGPGVTSSDHAAPPQTGGRGVSAPAAAPPSQWVTPQNFGP